MKKPLTRKTSPAKTREALIEEFLDLCESDITWHEDNPTTSKHIKKCIQVYRQIRPKGKEKK